MVRFVLTTMIIGVAIVMVMLLTILVRNKYTEDTTRNALIHLLQLDPSSSWVETEEYFDCSFIKRGMTIAEARSTLELLQPVRMTERFSEKYTGSIHVKFDNLPHLNDRTYYFVEGVLDFHSKAFDDPMEGSFTVHCN